MAYVPGFWFADGSMRYEKSYRISFSSIDLNHLKAVRKAAKSTSPIVRYYRHGLLAKTHYLCFHSKKLYFDLKILGGTPNKSKTLNFPPVPDKLLADFIRSYFDGDGSIHHLRYKHSKNGKIYCNIRSNFTCGSFSFLEKIRNHLTKEVSIYKKKLSGVRNPPTRWKIGYGEKDTKKLLKYMYYPGHPISLSRKKRFLDLLKS